MGPLDLLGVVLPRPADEGLDLVLQRGELGLVEGRRIDGHAHSSLRIRAWSRSSNFLIFPTGLRGIASMIPSRSGKYCLATCWESRNRCMAAKSKPGPATANAQVRSPSRSSGMATMA